MRGYPQFSFRISIALVKINISWIIISRGKNTFELVGTVLKYTNDFAKFSLYRLRNSQVSGPHQMKRNRDILNYRISEGRNTVASIQLNLMWVKISLMLFHLKSVPIDCLKCHRAETTEQRTNPNRGDSKRRFKQ